MVDKSIDCRSEKGSRDDVGRVAGRRPPRTGIPTSGSTCSTGNWVRGRCLSTNIRSSASVTPHVTQRREPRPASGPTRDSGETDMPRSRRRRGPISLDNETIGLCSTAQPTRTPHHNESPLASASDTSDGSGRCGPRDGAATSPQLQSVTSALLGGSCGPAGRPTRRARLATGAEVCAGGPHTGDAIGRLDLNQVPVQLDGASLAYERRRLRRELGRHR